MSNIDRDRDEDFWARWLEANDGIGTKSRTILEELPIFTEKDGTYWVKDGISSAFLNSYFIDIVEVIGKRLAEGIRKASLSIDFDTL